MYVVVDVVAFVLCLLFVLCALVVASCIFTAYVYTCVLQFLLVDYVVDCSLYDICVRMCCLCVVFFGAWFPDV